MPETLELSRGDRVAWVTKANGKTSGVSMIHRVFEGGQTYCLHPLPDADRQLDLRLIALESCSRCERLWKRAASFEEAVSAV